MPTRRVMELTVIVVLALKPVTSLAKLWAHKTLASTQPGGIAHGTASIVNVAVSG